MSNAFSKMLGVAAIAMLPMMASAAVMTDIGAGQEYLPQGQIAAGTTGETFTFTALEGLKITGITAIGVGTSAGIDLAKVSFMTSPPFSAGTSGAFTSIMALPFGGATRIGAVEIAGGYYLNAGNTFTISFLADPAVTRNVNLSVDMLTSPVPVPAAGLMLLAALAGAAGLRRRKAALSA